MNFLQFIVIFALVSIISMDDAQARRPDQCGVIDSRDAKGLYKEANRIWYIFDIREDINYACTVMEQLESWRDKRADVLSDAEEEYLDNLEGYVEEELFTLSEPMAIIRAWKEVKAATTVQKAKRISHLREAKNDLQSILDDLSMSLNDIVIFSKEKDRAMRVSSSVEEN